MIVSTVYLYPCGLHEWRAALPALALVLVPALLMVSTIRFRSVKAMEVGWRRSYLAIFLAAVTLALIAVYPRVALVVMSYTYRARSGSSFWADRTHSIGATTFPNNRRAAVRRRSADGA